MDSLDQLYAQALTTLERFVHRLDKRVPPPQFVTHRGTRVFRHVEKTIGQAIVQKLVRMVSTLHAARLLQNHGFVQEQGAIQRMLDEIQDDVRFLTYGVIFDDLTSLHQRYLNAFFEEEFDGADALGSTQKRRMISRKDIRAYNARKTSPNPSLEVEASRTIHKIFSGYVHVASSHVMDMYGGNPPRFHMSGMKDTLLRAEHQKDLWNCFYRGTVALALAARALVDDAVLLGEIHDFYKQFERTSMAGRGNALGDL